MFLNLFAVNGKVCILKKKLKLFLVKQAVPTVVQSVDGVEVRTYHVSISYEQQHQKVDKGGTYSKSIESNDASMSASVSCFKFNPLANP